MRAVSGLGLCAIGGLPLRVDRAAGLTVLQARNPENIRELGLGCRRRLQTPMAERETCGIGFWRTLLQHFIGRLLAGS